jgi:hypothetical protein
MARLRQPEHAARVRALAALRRVAPVLVGLLACACPSAPKEGPPPAESLEIASAAPHALGALAGGTQAAPHAVTSPGGVVRQAPDEPAPDPDEDDDAGAPPAADAGASSPEDVPL